MRAVGLTCGIGSMLVGARQAGFEVVGNVEWRKYYYAEDAAGRNTFRENFPGAVFKNQVSDLTPQEIERIMNSTLALGHPECGNFSNLAWSVKNIRERALDPADIPLFVGLVQKVKPRFWVMDDLPRSFAAYSMSKYAEELPEYDLFPEWISNWGYGNVQKHRNRMFMIGALRAERWAFRPGEVENPLVVSDVLGGMGEPGRSNLPNHDVAIDELDCFRALNVGEYRRKLTWGETKEYFRDKPGGHILRYVKADGSTTQRIGFVKGHWDGPAHTLSGGNATIHHHRLEPYTIRERARIQGFPDDFIFYGTIVDERGRWCHDLNQHMVRQTGKAMPVQFCTYVSKSIAAHVRGEDFETSDMRIIPPNSLVDQAKQWYCENVGYSNQEAACAACWLYDRCTIRMRKYQIGEPKVGQRDLIDSGVVPIPEPRAGAERTPGAQHSGLRRPPAAVPRAEQRVRLPRRGPRFAEFTEQKDFKW